MSMPQIVPRLNWYQVSTLGILVHEFLGAHGRTHGGGDWKPCERHSWRIQQDRHGLAVSSTHSVFSRVCSTSISRQSNAAAACSETLRQQYSHNMESEMRSPAQRL